VHVNGFLKQSVSPQPDLTGDTSYSSARTDQRLAGNPALYTSSSVVIKRNSKYRYIFRILALLLFSIKCTGKKLCILQRRHNKKIEINTTGGIHALYFSLLMKLELGKRVFLFHALFNDAVSASRLYRVGLNHIILVQYYTSITDLGKNYLPFMHLEDS
jgi:hypothetical protein